MKRVHLLIPDLLPPPEWAAEACAGLHLPALEKLLARGRRAASAGAPLESRLEALFGLPADAGWAGFSAAFDGLEEGCWLCADPGHLHLRREQLLSLPDVRLDADEANEFCESLNLHFSGEGLAFVAPHPQRWYVRLDAAPQLHTTPFPQTLGRDVRGLLPDGPESARWRRLFNEIQMLLFAHPLNARREARGELAVNCLWLWGNGRAGIAPQQHYRGASSDSVSVAMLARASATPFGDWAERWQALENGAQLLVWSGLRQAVQRADPAAWRNALQAFESGYAQPLWQALRRGELHGLQLEASSAEGGLQLDLKRADAWRFWRRSRPLAAYAMV